jgi:hypothetical protein
MSIKVPYLADADIEKRASALLAEYSSDRNTQVRAPIPLDDILVHLGLRLDLDDLRTTLGILDVLGALWIEEKRIYIDQSLDPDERPSALGRFNFTLGHEIGHWCLHRPYVEIQQLQGDLLQTSSCPSIVCRTSQQRERIELQADAFAHAAIGGDHALASAARTRAPQARPAARPGKKRSGSDVAPAWPWRPSIADAGKRAGRVDDPADGRGVRGLAAGNADPARAARADRARPQRGVGGTVGGHLTISC